jgi:hypothetical protein
MSVRNTTTLRTAENDSPNSRVSNPIITKTSFHTYSSPNIYLIKSTTLREAGSVARMGNTIRAYMVLVGRPEGKKLFGRPRHR